MKILYSMHMITIIDELLEGYLPENMRIEVVALRAKYRQEVEQILNTEVAHVRI